METLNEKEIQLQTKAENFLYSNTMKSFFKKTLCM